MTRLLSFAVVSSLLGAYALAQSTTTTCPPGYETSEAASYAYHLGGWANHHLQVIHGENKGTPGSFKKLSVRLERFPHGNTPLPGRKWTRAGLTMAEGPTDYASTSTYFKRNQLTTPTTVFSSNAVHWPATNSGYGMDPAPWGVPADLAFPFRTPWAFTGRNGICADFDFRGGTLDNAQRWSSLESYYLDAVPRYQAGGSQYRLYGDPNCRATGRSSYNSYHPEIATYATDHPTYPGKFRYVFRYRGLPASAASTGAVLTIGIAGNPKGTPFLGSCNPLVVQLDKLVVALPFTPGSSGSGYAPFASHQLLDYSPAFAGVDIWSQIAYDDGTPRRIQLTMAGRNRMWYLPTAKRAMVFTKATLYGAKHNDLIPVLFLQ